ncbi:very-long-chain enoyl-CoA reductase isoform X2 [Oncorhynchus tshawytscha]|uniref:very-long-chain enoyl-CoA reductase isoform X2 n=1 Tax=Oncorhynchus tshawytscha TaxID=74940 RepID=UPI001C3E0B55|nr:very-long-chain enoyl-CoA reductase isoform X2 [Oncorhynchus tshawytscha]
MDLKSLFVVAQFIKARCAHGMTAGKAKKDKNYVFYEVEIQDSKKLKLCYLDKILNGTQPDRLCHFTQVFLAECIGPLFIYLFFYLHLLNIYEQKDDYTSNPCSVVTLACVCHCFHYFRRLLETVFIHRFSDGTLPLQIIMRNCLYYWGFSAWLAYYINHPLYTPPSYGNLQIYSALVLFMLCEAGNFSIHLALNNLGCNGLRPKRIPYPTRNPFTWLFFFVSCPNYTYEVGTWLSFSIMTQCVPVALFTLLGFIQMTIWARGKHKMYTREFTDYPELRSAIIPLFL